MTAGNAYAIAEPRVRSAHRHTAGDVLVGLFTVAVMAVVGAIAGLGWQAWSPARPPAEILGGGQYIPDETEAFIAGDGRFLVLTAAIGLVAALALWFLRRRNRGVAVAAGLVLGGLAGAALTSWSAG